jgi:PAS domain S-box-containing protein
MFYAAQPNPPYATIYISPEFESFGYPLEQWRSNAAMWTSVLHADDRDWVLKATDQAMSSGRETDYKYRIIAQDGSVRWVHDCGRFIADETGRMICWQGVMLDITEQKQAEDDLCQSEKRYREMFEKNRAIKLVIDVESRAIVDVNPAACEFYGYSLDDFKTKKITDINILPPKQVAFELQRAASEKRNYFNFRHRLASGEVRDVEVHSSPFTGQNGKLLYSIVYDVTERIKAEAALKESEMRYRQLVEQASDIIYRTDINGHFVFVNSATAKLFKCCENEIAGLHFLELVHPAHREAVSDFYEKQFVERTAETYYEFTAVNCEGAEISIGQNVRLLTENNRVIGFQAVARNITKRVRAEEALKESEARLRDIFENANDIIYTHDLAGNYTSINNAAERVFGYTREEALEMNIKQIIAPESLKIARRNLEAKAAGAKQAVYEVNCITKDGRIITIEVNSRTIYKNEIAVGVQGATSPSVKRRKKLCKTPKHNCARFSPR